MMAPAALRRALLGPASGLIIALVAVSPPMHAAADASLAAHMVQHLVLILAAAPMLALGHPVRVLLWILPTRPRRSLAWWARVLRPSPGAAPAAAVGAWLVHVGVVWAWHMPRLYGWAIASPAAHALEHLSLIVTAWAFWRVLLSGRALNPGGAVVYLFAAAGQGTALGALLAFSETPWYAAHAASGAAGGFTALEDQQLAGLIMWLPGGLAYTAVALAMLARTLRGGPATAGMLLALPAVAAIVTACGTDPRAPAPIALGDAARGRQAIAKHGCAGCHAIPGVRGPRGSVGPPLKDLGARPYLAGSLVNDPANLIDWVRQPRRLDPRTVMPDLGVTEREARDIAAYLYQRR